MRDVLSPSIRTQAAPTRIAPSEVLPVLRTRALRSTRNKPRRGGVRRLRTVDSGGTLATASSTGDETVMDPQPQSNVTLLREAMDRDPAAPAKLLPLIYDELRNLARQRLRGERAGHTLQATALVHEAYVRLIGNQNISWESRAHFFGACANAMRQILVDHARSRGAKKRGGGLKAQAITTAEVADTQDLDLILSINDCIDRLRAEDPRAATVVELRFFSGLEMNEIA